MMIRNNTVFGVDRKIFIGFCLTSAYGLLLLFILPKLGAIPVGDGYGWDGSVFKKIIASVVNGHYEKTDPYRAIRTVGFPLLYLLQSIGVNDDIIFYQQIFNIILMLLSSMFLYMTIVINNINVREAIISLALFMISWCVLIVPVFTPVLSDHMVILIAAASLFFWSIHSVTGLGILIVIGVWVMPSSFLVPLALIAFPRNQKGISKSHISVKALRVISVLLVLLMASLLALFLGNELFMGIERHGLDASRNITHDLTGSRALIPVSILFAIAMVYLTVSLALKLVTNNIILGAMSIRFVIVGISLSLLSFMALRLAVDFNNGFSGPPLIKNLIKQTFSAPGKTWLAHMAYFGPVVLIVYFHLFSKKIAELPAGIIVCLAGFFPMLAFGSESRQWIAIFPVLIVALAFFTLTFRARILILLFSLFLMASSFSLTTSISEAMKLNVGLQDTQWQVYFGRVGPWMSMTSYRYYLLVGITFIALYFLTNKAAGENKRK